MSAASRTLSTADERRVAVLDAAEHVFAARGLHGTPTTEIAKAAGISHAYLFRLYPTKTELFVALVRRVNERLRETFTAAATEARAGGEDVEHAMGCAYTGLLEDRNWLLLQLHAHSACDDPAIRAEVRDGFKQLVELVQRETGAGPEEISRFFATGMLLNVLAAMQVDESDEADWAQTLMCSIKSDDAA